MLNVKHLNNENDQRNLTVALCTTANVIIEEGIPYECSDLLNLSLMYKFNELILEYIHR